MDTGWDPKVLEAFREEFGLSKADMERLLRDNGLPSVNWGTYYRWETGEMTPRPVYQDAIMKALRRIRAKLEAQRPKKGRR